MEYEYLNIEQVDVDSIVECTSDWSKHGTPKGSLHIVKKVTGSGIYISDNRGKMQNYAKDYFKLVKTKHGSEAKSGDIVMFIRQNIGGCEQGKVYTVQRTGTDDKYIYWNPANGNNRRKEDFIVLCKEELKSANDQSLVELSELYESGTKLQYRLPRQKTWCSYNDDKNRPDLKTEQATEYEYKVAGNPFKTGDRVRSLTHGGSYRYIGSEHTVHGIDKDEVYYMDGFAADHENFELIEKVVESNSEPKEFEDDNIQYLDSYENFKVGQTIYRTATGQVGLAQGYHTRLLAIRREGSRINLELIDSNGLTRKSCTVAAWKPAGVQPEVESEKISYPNQDFIEKCNAWSNKQKGNIMQENISITMTAKEFAKHQANPEPKVKTDLQLEKKKPFSAKVFDENGKYSKRLFAKTNPKLEDLISEHLHRNNFDVIIDSTTHKTHTLKRQPVEVK